MRQSKDADFEAPFTFLLFGEDRALLLDTGAVDDDALRETVDRLMADWLAARPRSGYQLVVAHTHAHADHVAGDRSFVGRPDTLEEPGAPAATKTALDAWIAAELPLDHAFATLSARAAGRVGARRRPARPELPRGTARRVAAPPVRCSAAVERQRRFPTSTP
jgi:glyoxylase-like metal-dependent hydrolase (beta-lactamase superfamily II)